MHFRSKLRLNTSISSALVLGGKKF